MEFKELTTVKFFGSANVKNSISWSEDNKVAVITQKGVNVLDLCLSRKSSASELVYIRSLIVPHASRPTYDTGLRADRIFEQGARLQVFEMVMDPLLYVGHKYTENQSPETLQAVWSPAGMADWNSCLLATRQSTGSVVIYQRRKTTWLEVLDITELWVNYLRDKVWKLENVSAKPGFPFLKTKVQQIEATSMSWSQMVREEGSCWCLLFVGHKDGTVVAWKVKKTSTYCIKASIAFQLAMKLDRICHLSWHSNGPTDGMLVLGHLCGVVRILMVGDIRTAHTEALRVQSMWDEQDMIAVSSAVAFCQDDDWLITAIKGSCIVVLAVSSSGEHLAKNIANLGTLDISGLQYIGENSLTLVTQCGSLNNITLKFIASKKELELECQDLVTKLNTKNYNIQGISTSKNKMIYAVTMTVSTPHDHLGLRNPTETVFFTLTNFDNAWEQLQQQKEFEFGKSWDYLELIRILGRGMSWAVDLSSLQDYNQEKIRLVWWLVVLKLMDDKETNRNYLREMQHQLEIMILRFHACHVLKLAASCSEQTEAEKCSVRLFKRFLRQHVEACQSKGESVNSVPPEFLVHDPQDDVPEICAICSAEVIYMNSTVKAICKMGHNLPRCALSLLPCCEAPLRSCPNCELVVLQKPEKCSNWLGHQVFKNAVITHLAAVH